MNLVLLLQIIFLIVTFILTLLCVLLPLRLVPQDPTRVTSPRAQRLISFANCLSGGVFLGTCYAQLIPFIDAKFAQVFVQAGWSVGYVSTVTQSTVCVGFFFILTIEQLVKVCQEGKKKRVSRRCGDSNQRELLAISADVSDNSTGSDDSDSDSSLDSKKHMLRKTKPSRKKTLSNGMVGISPSVPSNSAATTTVNVTETAVQDNHHAHHAHHGHSHITDIAQHEFGLRCLLLLAALSTHSLFEGLAVGLQDSLGTLINLFVGVIVHECLMSFAMGVTLAQQRLRISTVVKLCLAYSFMIPLGMAVGMGIGGIHNFSGNFASAIIQAVTAGTFVYVIFLEILPAEINSDTDRLLKVLFMFLGFILILCLRFALDIHH